MRVKPPKYPPRLEMPGHKLAWYCVLPYGVRRAVGGEVRLQKAFH